MAGGLCVLIEDPRHFKCLLVGQVNLAYGLTIGKGQNLWGKNLLDLFEAPVWFWLGVARWTHLCLSQSTTPQVVVGYLHSYFLIPVISFIGKHSCAIVSDCIILNFISSHMTRYIIFPPSGR